MNCDVCSEPYSIPGRPPLVLQCGHSFCSSCVQQVSTRGSPISGSIRCPTCRQPDARPVSDLPRNYGLADAARLDVVAQLSSLSVREGMDSARQLAEKWLDASELELSTTEIGRGATSQVVEGTYKGRPVRGSAVQRCLYKLPGGGCGCSCLPAPPQHMRALPCHRLQSRW